jgi:Inovirus Coat protein B
MFKKIWNKSKELVQRGKNWIERKLSPAPVAAGTGLILIANNSHAALADDVTAAVGTFAEVNTAVPVVGAAFLLALGILAAWKLVRGAFA